jgi:hypothetical protein
MANKSATIQRGQGGNLYQWENITEADTAVAQQIEAGKYTVSVEGTFGGGSIELKFGKTSGTVATFDVDNMTFDENGSYNLECGRGFVQPVRTGGSSMDVDITLTPIPRS